MPTFSTSITDPNKALMRDSVHVERQRTLNVVPKIVVATARVNQATIPNPVSQLTVDATSAGWGDIKEGMLVWVGSEAESYDIATGIVRKAPNSTTLYIDARSKGDPRSMAGTRGIIRAIQDDHYITVLKFYPPFLVFSRIDNNVFFKNYDLPYSGQLRDLLPVANIGTWRCGFVAPTTVTFDFSAANSVAYQGKTISSYLWDLDGGSVFTGTLTSQNLSASFAAGFYVVSCKVTDSSGKSHTARTYVWANSQSGANAPFSMHYPVTVSSLNSERAGAELAFEVYGEGVSLFPYAGVLYTETPLYNGEAVTQDVVFDTFVGYLGDYDNSNTRVTRQQTHKALSPIRAIASLPNPTQQLTETPVPRNWAEITLATPLTALDYLLRWHVPNVLANHDFIADGDYLTLRKKTFSFQSEGMGAQINAIESLALANVGSLDDGTTLMCLDPMTFSNDDRNDLQLRWDWQHGDFVSPLQFPINIMPQSGYIKAYAFAYAGGDSVPLGAGAPGKLSGWGSNKPNLPTVIVPVANGQFRLLEIVGHRFAYDNREIPTVRLTLNRNLDIAQAADLRQWHILVIEDLKDLADNYPRALPLRVNRTWRKKGNQLLKQITIDFDLEAFGQPGIPIDPERGWAIDFISWDGWTVDDPIFYDPQFADYGLDNADWGLGLAWNDLGLLGRTQNFLHRSPTWERITGFSGLVKDAAWEGGINNQAVFVTWDAATSTARLYTIGALNGIPVPTPVLTKSWTVTGHDGRFKVYTSESANGIVGVVWSAPNGIYVIRRDYFAGWGSAVPTLVSIASSAPTFSSAFGEGTSAVTNGALTGATYAPHYAALNAAFADVDNYPDDNASGAKPSPVMTSRSGTRMFATLDIYKESGAGGTLTTGYTVEGLDTQETLASESTQTTATAGPSYYGYGYSFRLPSAQEGKVDLVSSISLPIEIQTSYPPAASSDPSDFPPDDFSYWNMEIEAQFTVRDEDGAAVHTQTVTFESLVGGTLNYLPSPMLYDWLQVIKGYTFTVTFGTPRRVASVEIQLRSSAKKDYGSVGYFARGLAPSVLVAFVVMPLFNPTIVYTNTITEGWRLYRIDNFDTGSPSYTDITASRGAVPLETYSLGVDRATAGEAVMIGTDVEGTRKLYLTSSDGSTWASDGVTTYKGVKRAGDALLLWGFNALDLSEDLNDTRFSRLGTWREDVGGVGTIEGALVTYEQ